MKTVVIFQGGGPLGAYGCGAWTEIADWLRAGEHELIAVAGSSIGALNAAIVTTQYRADDRGASFLAETWRERIATPSFPFAGLPLGNETIARRIQAWNGFLTGFLIGNRGLFAPAYMHWNPLSALLRREQPLFSQERMGELLTELVGEGHASSPESPALLVGAVSVLDGRLQIFSSDQAPLTSDMLAASAAIPLVFAPVWIDGELFWDGEVTRESMVGPVLRTLRETGRTSQDEPLQLVLVEHFSRETVDLPRTSGEIIDRIMHLTMQNKQKPDLAQPQTEWRHCIRISRTALVFDNLSGQFDYSPERIDLLIEQGTVEARVALLNHEENARKLASIDVAQAQAHQAQAAATSRSSARKERPAA